jgi:hypothetical protein
MAERTWWELLTGPSTGGADGSGFVTLWAGFLLAALLAGVAVGWWLRGRRPKEIVP